MSISNNLSPVLNVEQLTHNWVEFNPSTLARRLKRTFIRRTNDETNYCRTVDE